MAGNQRGQQRGQHQRGGGGGRQTKFTGKPDIAFPDSEEILKDGTKPGTYKVKIHLAQSIPNPTHPITIRVAFQGKAVSGLGFEVHRPIIDKEFDNLQLDLDQPITVRAYNPETGEEKVETIEGEVVKKFKEAKSKTKQSSAITASSSVKQIEGRLTASVPKITGHYPVLVITRDKDGKPAKREFRIIPNFECEFVVAGNATPDSMEIDGETEDNGQLTILTKPNWQGNLRMAILQIILRDDPNQTDTVRMLKK